MRHGLTRLWAIVNTDVVTVGSELLIQAAFGGPKEVKHGIDFYFAQLKKRTNMARGNDERVAS
jgi:hypothetical protein